MSNGSNGTSLKYQATVADLIQLTGSSFHEIIRDFEADHNGGAIHKFSGLSPAQVRKFLEEKGVDFSFRVIPHINLRGGIGKTTSTVSTASRASQYGFNTCIIDMDSQGSASLALDAVPEEGDPVFLDVWQNPGDMVMGSLKKIDESLFILPSSLENGLLDTTLTNPAWQKSAVRNVCNELKENGFDLVIIDCPPSLGASVISSICAADTVVIPVGNDPFSIRGLELTVSEIESISETFGIPKPDIRVLYSKFDKREKMSFKTLDLLNDRFASHLAPVLIRTSTQYSKVLDKRETVFASKKKNPAKDDYDRFARHILGMDRVFPDLTRKES